MSCAQIVHSATKTSRLDYGTVGSPLNVISLDRDHDSSLRHGRLLSAPALLFGGDVDVRVSTDHTWELQQPLFQPAAIPTWAVLIFEPALPRRGCDGPRPFETFIQRLKACFEGFGHLPNPQLDAPLRDPVVVSGTQCGSALGWLDQVRRRMPDPPAFIIAILPQPSDDVRWQIKHRCLTQLGVPLQIVEYSKAATPRDAFLKGLALKINLKLGGTNWVIPRLMMPYFDSLRDTMMLIGLSTAPLPQGSCNISPGVGVGIVVSYDRPLARFVSAAEVQLAQPDGSIVDLDEILLELLIRRRRAYPPIPTSATARERSEILQMIYPKVVVIYRVGLEPEQYAAATKKEITAIRAAMVRVQTKFKETSTLPPHTAYIAIGTSTLKVQPVPAAMGDGFGNCAPGSVFDSGFAAPDAFNFYLTNYSGLNSAPKLYTVQSYDSVLLNSDFVQQITYNLSYMIGTSACPVSLPSPARYAELVCKSIRYLWEPEFDPCSVATIAVPEERLALLKRKLQAIPFTHYYKMWVL